MIGAVWLCKLLGGWDGMLACMFIMMALDYLTGILVAFTGKSLKTESGAFKSSVAFTGLMKKLTMLIVVAVAVVLDNLMASDGVCRTAAIGFFVANEGLSIIENAGVLGVPIPAVIVKMLDVLRQKSSSAAEAAIEDVVTDVTETAGKTDAESTETTRNK